MNDSQDYTTVETLDRTSNPHEWSPHFGCETQELLEHTLGDETAYEPIASAACNILAQGIDPASPDSRAVTELVVGYIQSGKTMSFEALAALGRDNGFQLVIVVAGTKNTLLEQTTNRLCSDFRLHDTDRPRKWLLLQNPESDDCTLQQIRNVLEDWRDACTPESARRTLLVTVLKQHTRLGKLREVLESLDLSDVTALIIDDEADQASLNTAAGTGDESTTYSCLAELRNAVPRHTFAQYTATPQAPLLLNIIDALSPEFVHVLEPGDEYTGGREFFGRDDSLIRDIPMSDIVSKDNIVIDPPESLEEALRVFLVGVTAGLFSEDGCGCRSMLVHPSHLQDLHKCYALWTQRLVSEWSRLFVLPEADPDREDLIEEFRAAHNDLAATVGADFPAFDDLVLHFSRALRNVKLLEINTREGATPKVSWQEAYAWILIGGQAIDRGFTVEGLTVTYMPRGTGVGNVDTIQQRGRFFGYKRGYLGFCRVYLEQSTRAAFDAYIAHEDAMRKELKEVQRVGGSLNDWKRKFILDPKLNLCRASVVELGVLSGGGKDQWYYPRVGWTTEEVAESNSRVVRQFMNGKTFMPNFGHSDRTPQQIHGYCCVPLREVLEELLIKTRVPSPGDSEPHTGMLLELGEILRMYPDAEADVYHLSYTEKRYRSITSGGIISKLFQGAYPVVPVAERGKVYPGDSEIRSELKVTVQIHFLELRLTDGQPYKEGVIVATHVPARLSTGWAVQDQPEQQGNVN